MPLNNNNFEAQSVTSKHTFWRIGELAAMFSLSASSIRAKWGCFIAAVACVPCPNLEPQHLILAMGHLPCLAKLHPTHNGVVPYFRIHTPQF